jgi:hypothetical protein
VKVGDLESIHAWHFNQPTSVTQGTPNVRMQPFLQVNAVLLLLGVVLAAIEHYSSTIYIQLTAV